LIGEEPYFPYHRPPLSKTALDPEREIQAQMLRPESFYHDQEIEVCRDERVLSIDRDSKRLLTTKGERNYTKLILATGSTHREIPIRGVNSEKVFRLRNLSDAEKIRNQVAPGKNAVLVGAGYIGLEVAASLRRTGMNVAVVEVAPRVLSRVTSPVVSEFFQKLHRRHGVELFLKESVTEIKPGPSQLQVCLTKNKKLDCDLVVMGTGAKANSQLASAAGLEVEDGIRVDEHCRTSDPDVYAIGDCSRHPQALYNRSCRLESVQNAVDQAKCAAASLCGKELPPATVPWFWSDQYDVKLQTVGLGEGADQVVVRGNPEPGNVFSVWYYRQGRLCAVDAVNESIAYAVGSKLLKAGLTPDPEAVSAASLSLKDFLKTTMEKNV
jgi:3-phenylpropionate/trans-cinnamate dioxygenase ferredoxin reductase subunit